MVGQVFLAYQGKPPKWRIFKMHRWKKGIENYNNTKDRVLKYR